MKFDIITAHMRFRRCHLNPIYEKNKQCCGTQKLINFNEEYKVVFPKCPLKIHSVIRSRGG